MKLSILFSVLLIYLGLTSCSKTEHNDSTHLNKSGNPTLVQRSGDEFCFDEEAQEDCVQIATAAVQLLYVDGYSPCQVYASYDLWKCRDNNVLRKYVITNFRIDLLTNGCDSLLDRWDSIAAVPDYATLVAEMDAFYAKAEKSLERYLIGQLFSNTAYRDTFPCSGGSYGLFAVDFYTAQCFIWCVTEFPNEEPPYTSWQKLVCGTACCKKETPWCWTGTTYQEGTPSITDFGECGEDTLDPCYGGTEYGECDDHTCQ